LDSVNSTVLQLYESISNQLGNIPDPNALWQALLHFVHAVLSPKLSTLAVSVVGIFSSLKLIPVSMIATATTVFGAYISKCWKGSPEAHSEPSSSTIPTPPPTPSTRQTVTSNSQPVTEPQVQTLSGSEDDAIISNLVGFIVSAISCIICVKVLNPDTSALNTIFKAMPNIWTCTTHITRFLKETLGFFKQCFQYVMSWFPNAAQYDHIANNPDFVKKFVREAAHMINPANFEAVKTQPSLRSRFWVCVLSAYYIRSLFETERRIEFSVHLHRLANEVIELSKTLSVHLLSCPVRYEPFTIYQTGPPGIGKSFASRQFISDILSEYGYRGYGDPVLCVILTCNIGTV
jgi:hypothetical protein